MAIKKKAKNLIKKTSQKLSVASNPSEKPSMAAKKPSAGRNRSQKVIDEMLVKISPSLQAKINHLVAVLENSREGRLGDLSLLAGKILLRAQEVSKGLKSIRKKKKS